MKRAFYGILLVTLVVLVTACATVPPEKPGTIEIKKVGAFSYMRETSDMAIVVDVELAQKRTEEPYFPLGIKIANKRLNRIVVDRETLVLVDEKDQVYKMPDIVELEQKYNKLVPDHKFQSQTGILGDTLLTSFSYYRRAESRFFPQVQGAARVINSVYLPTTGYMEDLIYFPMPVGGIKGKNLRLRLEVFELDAPFDIIFPIQ
jgi:hypothetical protein